ncbi:hypothetical protein GGE24_000311 [Bradyrhizobium centrosematis]|nr:hypothetical protein [Bradyrhizobium centrosematis]MCS3761113.1 hypothetical protein [Bradyrhizobium centrosematis]MCS3770999.1 hypothetical protein [Bradyrhizobium centrosematis]
MQRSGVGQLQAPRAQSLGNDRRNATTDPRRRHRQHERHQGDHQRNARYRVISEPADVVGFHQDKRRLYDDDGEIADDEPQHRGKDRALQHGTRAR